MNSGEYPVTAIAYPLPSIKSPVMDPSNDNSYFLDHSSYASDAIEASGNFFSQLDSMIAAVKVESSALDTMREKLKEVDNLRAQITAFNKRLIDADQSNLSLKSALMKAQESYSELHKQKSELESVNVQFRQEAIRTKDLLSKEKAARQSAQQEIVALREKVGRYEAMIENYERDAKSIPVLQESNDILKNDLSNIRRKYKEEKAHFIKHIRQLESQNSNTEALKGEMRAIAIRLMDITNGTNTVGASNSSVVNAASARTQPSNNLLTSSHYGGGGSVASAVDFESDDDDDDCGSYQLGDDCLDEDSSIPDQIALNSSTESISKFSGRSLNSSNRLQSHHSSHMATNMGTQDSVVKKRKKKSSTMRQHNGNISLPRIN